MATISFDKGEYKAGETATISYDTLGAYINLRLKDPGGTELFDHVVMRRGAYNYNLSAIAPLGTYKAELYTYNPRIKKETIYASATMQVVSGGAPPPSPPPSPGETRDLELGDYEVTWTSSGYNTLEAEIRVADTGVTCVSVTGGACNRTTPPGVTRSAFTVTGHLKPSGVVPTKGYLTVNTSPTGALVMVDIVFPCGTTPVTACELDPGVKTVKITKSGRNPVTRSVTITAGQTTNLGTIALTPTGVPPVTIGSWIDESGVTNLTKNHALYVLYVSMGASGSANTKYDKLSPKPSRIELSLATKRIAIGIFYYSKGAMASGNQKTGCNY